MTTPTPRAMERALAFFDSALLIMKKEYAWKLTEEEWRQKFSEHLALAIDAAVEDVIKAEREACALMCLERAIKFKHAGDNLALPSVLAIVPQTRAIEAETLATAIRARGAS